MVCVCRALLRIQYSLAPVRVTSSVCQRVRGSRPHVIVRLHSHEDIGSEKLFNGNNPKKAQGPDELPCRILKELDNELTPAMTAIFNQSLKTGELPLVWNETIVTPIYEKGDRNLPVKYRPISWTCVCCKILEHHLQPHKTSSRYT